MQTRKEKDEYFMSLVAPKPVKKTRKCNKCGRKFVSESYGHRRCCYCTVKLSDLGLLAEQIYLGTIN